MKSMIIILIGNWIDFQHAWLKLHLGLTILPDSTGGYRQISTGLSIGSA